MISIAVVDDNKIYRDLQSDELSKFEISTFINCSDFLYSATSNQYDLIILDRHFDDCSKDIFHDSCKPEFRSHLVGTPSENAKVVLWTDDIPETSLPGIGIDFSHRKQIIRQKKVEEYLNI